MSIEQQWFRHRLQALEEQAWRDRVRHEMEMADRSFARLNAAFETVRKTRKVGA